MERAEPFTDIDEEIRIEHEREKHAQEAALAQDEEEDVTEASKRSAPEDCGCIGGVATVIAGVKTPSEVERAVAMMNVSIPKAFWTELKSAGLLPHTAPTP